MNLWAVSTFGLLAVLGLIALFRWAKMPPNSDLNWVTTAGAALLLIAAGSYALILFEACRAAGVSTHWAEAAWLASWGVVLFIEHRIKRR